MKLTLEQLLNYLTIAVTIASLIRIGLHWLRQPLGIWIKSEGLFLAHPAFHG